MLYAIVLDHLLINHRPVNPKNPEAKADSSRVMTLEDAFPLFAAIIDSVLIISYFRDAVSRFNLRVVYIQKICINNAIQEIGPS